MIEKIGYSVDEAVEASGIGRTTLYELMGSGEIESVKVGRRRIIPADSLHAYFNARREASRSGEPMAVPSGTGRS